MYMYFFRPRFSSAMNECYLHSVTTGRGKTMWRNGNEDSRNFRMDHMGIIKRNEACHKVAFHKGHWAGWQTSPQQAGAETICDFRGAYKQAEF